MASYIDPAVWRDLLFYLIIEPARLVKAGFKYVETCLEFILNASFPDNYRDYAEAVYTKNLYVVKERGYG